MAICVDGLSRQGRDLDRLAAALAENGYRVLCPDLVGRGRSDRLRNPDEHASPRYCVDMTAFIARSGAASVEWTGTSPGGLIGMVPADQPASPIRRLVVNDVGPFMPRSALHRLGSDFRKAPAYFASSKAYHRTVLAPFNELGAAEWRHLTEHRIERGPEGRSHMLCDPAIARAFSAGCSTT